MKCQVLFSGKNKKNIISLLSVELDQRLVKVNLDYCFVERSELVHSEITQKHKKIGFITKS